MAELEPKTHRACGGCRSPTPSATSRSATGPSRPCSARRSRPRSWPTSGSPSGSRWPCSPPTRSPRPPMPPRRCCWYWSSPGRRSRMALPLAAGVVVLLFILVLSYRQVIAAYPQGGGAYMVTRDNLGGSFAAICAAALLVDYVLTVAVSVSAGTAALASAVPACRTSGRDLGRLRHPADVGEPAGHPRVGQDLRRPHLRLHPQPGGRGRARGLPGALRPGRPYSLHPGRGPGAGRLRGAAGRGVAVPAAARLRGRRPP